MVKPAYRDILQLTDQSPQWWDEVGAPRFCEFHPEHLNDIYCQEAVLLLIACQCCGTEFQVAIGHSSLDHIRLYQAKQEAENSEKLEVVFPPGFTAAAERVTEFLDHLGKSFEEIAGGIGGIKIIRPKEKPKTTDEELTAAMKDGLKARILDGSIHYGDPPFACPDSCGPGYSMNSVPLQVLQYWERQRFEWVRNPELEIIFPEEEEENHEWK